MLFTILKASGIKIDFEIYQDLNHSSKIYTQEEVKKIILNDSPEALVVALGLKMHFSIVIHHILQVVVMM